MAFVSPSPRPFLTFSSRPTPSSSTTKRPRSPAPTALFSTNTNCNLTHPPTLLRSTAFLPRSAHSSATRPFFSPLHPQQQRQRHRRGQQQQHQHHHAHPHHHRRRGSGGSGGGGTTTTVAPTMSDAAVIGGVTEALEFLAATTIVIPIFRRLNLSPILGFLLAGVVLGPHGLSLISDVEDVRTLADFGVLFLLFEMGLELSLDRLRKLRKYAFGMGSVQILVTASVLGLGAYAMGGTAPESAVIGGALSLSSSAFILQILAEKGERQSRAGVATFGVLLMQDIAVVPLLLLVPLLGNLKGEIADLTNIGPEKFHLVREGVKHIVSSLGTLNFVILAGGAFLRRAFTIVADSRSAEAFTSAVLLTVLGTALFTEELGFSMTMGAFLAGILLAESSFRSRIKIDLEPFRGLFLGLFFITTGMSLDLSLFYSQPGTMAFLIGSLVFWKTVLCTLVGLPFGLSLAESLRVGLLLGQGSEFAFVLFTLANKLGFLPDNLQSFLNSTVVISMALTPLLYSVGTFLAPRIDNVVRSTGGTVTTEATLQEVSDEDSGFVLICGYGPVGRVVGRMLSRKFIRWVAVEIDAERVRKAAENNLPVVNGDSVRPTEFLEANNLSEPLAFVITQSSDELIDLTLGAIRSSLPSVPVYVRAKSVQQQRELLKRGARAMYPETFETSLQLGQSVLEGFRTSRVDISAIKSEVRGDYGLNEVFKECEDWYDQQGDEKVKDSTISSSTKGNGTASNGVAAGNGAATSNGTAGNGVTNVVSEQNSEDAHLVDGDVSSGAPGTAAGNGAQNVVGSSPLGKSEMKRVE